MQRGTTRGSTGGGGVGGKGAGGGGADGNTGGGGVGGRSRAGGGGAGCLGARETCHQTNKIMSHQDMTCIKPYETKMDKQEQ